MMIYDHRKKRKKGLFFLIALVFLIVPGAIWFFRPSPNPNDTNMRKSEPSKALSSDAIPLAVPGANGSGEAAVSGRSDVSSASSKKMGISTGSNVNVREDHSVGGAVVAKLSQGQKVEMLDVWTPETASEAVALVDFDAQIRGRSVKILKGRGVVVISRDEDGSHYMVRLPQDASKAAFPVPAGKVSKPLDWQWYRIRDDKKNVGWVFGKYIKPLGETKERDATLALLVREALGTFGGTREAVEAALGTPRRVITAKENPNIVLRYEGVLVTLNGNKGGSKVIALEVSSPEKGLKGGMVPGMSPESLRKLLGKPNKVDKKDESFLSGHGEGISVRFRKDGTAIESIRVGKL